MNTNRKSTVFWFAIAGVIAIVLVAASGQTEKREPPSGEDKETDTSETASDIDESVSENQKNELVITKTPMDSTMEPVVPIAQKTWAHLSGEWPKKMRKVSLAVTDESIAGILQRISKQLGFGLVLDAPNVLVEKKTTIRLIRKPARDVLEIVLENSGLEAELKGDILFVKPYAQQEEAILAQQGAGALPSAIPGVTGTSQKSPGASVISVVHGKGSKKGAGVHVHHGAQDNNRVQMGESLRIEANEEVGDAVAIGGSLNVAGRVLGDAVAVGGSVEIEPGAFVQGDAVAVGGTLYVAPDATVEGEQVGVGIPLPIAWMFKDDDEIDWNITLPAALSGIAGAFAAFTIIGILLRSVLLFVLGLIVLAIMPKRVERVRGYLTSKPGYSILGGLTIMLAFVPLLILLAITLIGIPLIPVAIIALLVLIVMGLTSLLIWFGYKVPLFKKNKTQIGAMAIGIAVFMLINLIPFLGPALLTFAGFAAAGAALLSRFGAEPKSQ
ncbi:MAG: hypothetical protein GY847_29085 [Proteobacteria bacterium]|nr:hypothetical protein [Pseudomonadota bacterium]